VLLTRRHHIINFRSFDADWRRHGARLGPAGVTGAIFSVALKQISSARMLGFRFHRNASPTYYGSEYDSTTRAMLGRTSSKQLEDTSVADARADTTVVCRVALVGFGTVGRAVAKILCETANASLRLTHICNRNVERKKQPWVPAM